MMMMKKKKHLKITVTSNSKTKKKQLNVNVTLNPLWSFTHSFEQSETRTYTPKQTRRHTSVKSRCINAVCLEVSVISSLSTQLMYSSPVKTFNATLSHHYTQRAHLSRFVRRGCASSALIGRSAVVGFKHHWRTNRSVVMFSQTVHITDGRD